MGNVLNCGQITTCENHRDKEETGRLATPEANWFNVGSEHAVPLAAQSSILQQEC